MTTTVESFYQNVIPLDRVQHRGLKLARGFNALPRSRRMNAVFIVAAEFADACREYPIVYVPAGKDPRTNEDLIAPMAVLGLSQNENLYLQQDETWRAGYVPAFLRRYPFTMGQLSPEQIAICIDREGGALSETEGEPLFDANGQATQALQDVQRFVENFEQETQRTKQFCAELQKAGVLRPMRFEATMPDQEKVAAEGFLAIDEEKLAQLPDAKVLEWHRNGILGLVQAQRISLGLMRRLAEWRAERLTAWSPTVQ
jgi:hypothetical protein